MRRRDYLKIATVSSPSVLGLTGCLSLVEENSEGGATTSPSKPPSKTTDSERKVPKVTNPLDTSSLKSGICAALSSDQLEKLNLEVEKKQEEENKEEKNRPECEYKYAGGLSSEVSIQLVSNDFKNGIAGLYAREKALGYFEAIEIAGYPAVFADKMDKLGRGYCQLYTGLSDTDVIRVIAQLYFSSPDYGLSRDVVELVTKAVIQNLKGGSKDLTLPNTASVENNGTVPSVTDPLDVSALKSDACTALSSDQLDKLGLIPKKRLSTPLCDCCDYEYSSESYTHVKIAGLKRFKNGIADIYARKELFNYFEPTQISGYPAVFAVPEFTGNEKESNCRIYIGLTDNFVVSVFTKLYDDTPDYGRPCEVVKLTAETMIQNLKNGS